MAEKIKRELYSFTVETEEEIEEEIIKERKKKNKETGKMETHKASNIGIANTPFILNMSVGYTF